MKETVEVPLVYELKDYMKDYLRSEYRCYDEDDYVETDVDYEEFSEAIDEMAGMVDYTIYKDGKIVISASYLHNQYGWIDEAVVLVPVV